MKMLDKMWLAQTRRLCPHSQTLCLPALAPGLASSTQDSGDMSPPALRPHDKS